MKGLIDKGHDVSIIDNSSSGSVQNLKDLGVDQEPISGDLKDYGFTRDVLKGADTVFHFAAEVGSVAYLHGSKAKELTTWLTNSTIDANVFKACLENNVGSIIYASSAAVYPLDLQFGADVQFKEEDSELRTNPDGGYGWAKFVAEKQLAMMPDVPSGAVRMFNVYGDNIYLKEDRSPVIGSLIRKAINYPKEDFVVWGDGSQKRCFVSVDDVIDALFRIHEHVKSKGSLTVNVGSTDEINVGDLARTIIAISKKDIPLKFDTSKPSGTLNRMPNIDLAKQVLGWAPSTSMDEGLRKTYAWAEKRLAKG